MRKFIVLTIFLAIGCGKNKDLPEDLPTAAPEVTIQGVFEYTNVNGTCAGAELFGDLNTGCVRFVQIVRFSDGSGFYSISVGQGFWWETSGYLSPDTTTWSKSIYFYSGNYYSYVFSGDLSMATPTFTVIQDRNHDLTDTASKTYTLIAQ